MATYKPVQKIVKEQKGYVPKNCWIAHVLADHGKTTRQARNRIDPSKRKHPCPDERRRKDIEEALRILKII